MRHAQHLNTQNETSDKLLIFGASGHAKDAISIAKQIGYSKFEIVTSDGSSDIEDRKATKESLFREDNYAEWHCFVAIGNNAHRKRFFETYRRLRFISLIAPSAEITESAHIGTGSYIGAQCYVGPDAVIGEGSIVNTHAIVGHDSIVGAFSQIGPKVCISGNVRIGNSVKIGAGALFKNGSSTAPLNIADDVNIGMGCHVTASIERQGIQIIPKPNHIGVKPQTSE